MEIVKHFEQETLMKPAATPFAALVAQTRTSHAGKEKSGQKGSAAFGVQVENSMSFIQKVSGAVVWLLSYIYQCS